jgi:ribosomal peptide maturation radical SAM protein 1
MDLLFAVLPFADCRHPSLGVSLLQAAVSARGFSSRVRYFNLDFAALAGPDDYLRVAEELPPEALVGEWFFADCVFGDQIPEARDYLGKVLAYFPAAEGFLANLLRLRGGREAFVDRCAREILDLNPRVVGFTTMFHQTCACLAVAARLKQAPDPPVVVFGGANCEGEMGEQLVRSFPWIDYVCTGEGDVVFPEFVERLLRGGDADAVEGMVGRRTVRPPTRPAAVRNLEALPYPDFADYFAQIAASPLSGVVEPGLVVETSRGCWWGAKSHCTFCGLNGTNMAYRSKTPVRAVREIRTLAETYGVNHCFAVDNILDMRYIREVFPELAASGLGLQLVYEIKANLTYEQLSALKAGGIHSLQPGIESLSNEALRLMRKGCTGLQNIQFLRWCEELGILAMWNLLFGFPGESPEECERQADLIPKLVHLRPPSSGGRFRLDRFSPMYMRPADFGLSRVRPDFAYYYAFPLGRAELEKLAYHFAFDYDDGRDPRAYAKRLADEAARWARLYFKEPGRAPRLDLRRLGDAVVIEDTRPCAVAPVHRLEGLAARVYLLCDSARGLNGLVRELSGEAGEAAVRDALGALLAAGLMAEMDGHYLSLAVTRDRTPRTGPEERHGELSVEPAPLAEPLLYSL